jgi:signal peptidase II
MIAKPSSRMPRNRLFGLLLALAIFVVDQLVKAWVVGPMEINTIGDARELLSFFDLRFVPNVGISLGLLPADGPVMRWALVLLTGAIAVGVAVWMWRERVRGDVTALAMVLGGALGNILDRVRLGYVVDFADLHFGEWRPFLVFNVADAAITVGVVILLIRSLFASRSVKGGNSGEVRNA